MTSVTMSGGPKVLPTGPSGVDSSKVTGDLKGRSVTHWSYKLFVTGSLIGVIAVVGTYALHQYAVTVCALLLAITNSCAAYYVKKLKILKNVSEYTQRLSEKVEELKKANEELHQVKEEMQEVPKNWKEQIDKGKAALNKKNKTLSRITRKLQATEEKLQQLASVAVEIQHKTTHLSEEAVKFTQENKLFSESVERVANCVRGLNQQNQNLDKLVKETEQSSGEFRGATEKLAKQVDLLEDLFGMMKELYQKGQEEMRGLEKQIDELKTVVPGAVQSSQHAEESSKQLAVLQKKFVEMFNKLEDAIKKVKKYKAYKESALEFQRLKEGKEWKEFQEWRTRE